MTPDWLVPHWPAPAHVRAVCTTRLGGKSVAPYDSMNLGDHVGDHPLNVGANRAILHQSIKARPVFLSQVHGADVVWLSEKTPHGTPGDGCLTAQPGVACTIMVADCLPVLFTNIQGSLVAAAHAGWRGLAGQGGYGVLEAVVDKFRAQALVDKAQDASEIIAWLGPCIGPQAFEVGDEVRDAYAANDPTALEMFAPGERGKWLANLSGLARLRLSALGITEIYGNDGNPIWCTVSNPSRFFSFRRDGTCGRMAASVWLE